MLKPSAGKRVGELVCQPIVSDVLSRLHKELSPKYVYHSVEHTKDVIEEAVCFALAADLSPREIELLVLAAAFHEVGFLVRPYNNEPIAAEVVVEAMKSYGGYSEDEQQLVRQMILDTEVQDYSMGPAQVANTELSKYLLDADLANLGRKDFFEKMKLIEQEMEVEEKVMAKQTLKLCQAHSWQTDVASKLLESKKQKNMLQLEEMLKAI